MNIFSQRLTCFLLFTLTITIQASPDPFTTVNIQNYDGSIYLTPNKNSGYGNTACDDQEIYINVIGPNNDDSSSGVYTKSIEESTGATITSSGSGVTVTSGVATSSGTSGLTSTLSLKPTSDCSCGCVSKQPSTCIPINCVTLCSLNSGSNYDYPGYRNEETIYNFPGTSCYGGESCFCYDSTRTTGYNYPTTSSNGDFYYKNLGRPGYNHFETTKNNNLDATMYYKQGVGYNNPEGQRTPGAGYSNYGTESYNGGASMLYNVPYYQSGTGLQNNYCDGECKCRS